MFLLPARIRNLLENQGRTDARRFSQDVELVDAGQAEALQSEAAEACWDSLSEREQEVLALVCLGQRNYEIAAALGIAHETVKTHLQHIFRKFGLRSKKELRLLLRDWDFAAWWDSRQAAGLP
jgi:DNA-binding CsgD family transcriptional regulator